MGDDGGGEVKKKLQASKISKWVNEVPFPELEPTEEKQVWRRWEDNWFSFNLLNLTYL